MSRVITQPVTQVRMTNVAIVRANRGGKRFEVACYKNKIVNWRNRVETDLSEVLQIETVFQNVSKGVLANKADIAKAFGTDNEDEVIRYILDKGEVQVSEKERKVQYESLFRDVATIISEKCVNPTSNRPYTVSMIENAMREIHFSVHPTKAAKAQALELIPRLKEVMPIERASMQLRVACSADQGKALKTTLEGLAITSFDDVTWSGGGANDEFSCSMLIDPGLFRAVEETVRTSTSGSGRVEVLQMSVQQEGEADIDLEAARKAAMKLKQQQDGTAAQLQQLSLSEKSGEHADTPKANEQQSGTENSTAAADAALSSDAKPAPKQPPKSKKQKRKDKEAAQDREQRTAELDKRQAERRSQQTHNHDDSSNGKIEQSPKTDADRPQESSSDTASNSSSSSNANLKCNTCSVAYDSTSDYREHFKSDWHRYNLKLKMKSLPAVSAEEFKSVDAEGFFFDER